MDRCLSNFVNVWFLNRRYYQSLSPATGYLGKWKIKSNSSRESIESELEIESEYTPAKTCENTIQPIRMVRYLENISIKDD